MLQEEARLAPFTNAALARATVGHMAPRRAMHHRFGGSGSRGERRTYTNIHTSQLRFPRSSKVPPLPKRFPEDHFRCTPDSPSVFPLAHTHTSQPGIGAPRRQLSLTFCKVDRSKGQHTPHNQHVSGLHCCLFLNLNDDDARAAASYICLSPVCLVFSRAGETPISRIPEFHGRLKYLCIPP